MAWSEFSLVIRHETNLMSRDWTWRIFTFIALSGIALLPFALPCVGENSRWGLVASAAHVPYLNAYFFNLFQSLFIIFSITDVFSREKRRGWNECIYAHPIDNSTYLWGKITSVLGLYVIMGGCSVFISCLLHLFASDAPFYFPYYLFYFFTLTLPALCFLTGLGVWLSGIVRSRFFSQIILLCLFALTVFWGSHVHGVFDFLGNSLPNMFSDMTGHPCLSFYLLQRSMYLLSGVGFIVASVVLLKRLPNRVKRVRIQFFGGGLIVFAGIVLGLILEFRYREDERERACFQKSYFTHWDFNVAHVEKHAIVLEQKKERIFVESKLVITNPHTTALPRLILFLNPGLKVSNLTGNGHPLTYTRDHQSLIVERVLQAGDSIHLEIRYDGCINENLCDIHLTEQESRESSLDYFIFRFGRKHSFINDDFLLLSPACVWYPTVVPPAFPGTSCFSYKDFTRFHLSVLHPRQARLVSQGKVDFGEDRISFTPSLPIAGISLCGGAYESKSLTIRNTRCELFYFKGHDFFSRYFKHVTSEDLQSGIQQSISCGSRVEEFVEGCRRYDQQFLCVEVPIAFQKKEYFQVGSGQRVQPGLLFLSEWAIDMNVDNFRNNYLKKKMLRNEMTETEIEVDLFTTWINSFFQLNDYLESVSVNNLLGKQSGSRGSPNSFNILPMLGEVRTTLYSKEWPYLDLFIKYLLREEVNLCQYFTVRPSLHEWEVRHYLQGKTIDEVLRSVPPVFLQDILRLKGEHLLDYLTVHVSRQELFRFIRSFFNSHPNQIALQEFACAMEDSLRVDFLGSLLKWAACKHDGLIKMKDEGIFPVQNSELRMGRVKVFNNGTTEELVSCQILRGNSMENHHFYLQPGEAKEVNVIDVFTFFKVNTLSRNIPGEVAFLCNFLTMKNENAIAVSSELKGGWYKSDVDPSEFNIPDGEIIVDNEDSTCFKVHSKKSLIQKFWERRKEERQDVRKFHRQTNSWIPVFSEDAYGEYMKNYLYKSGGDGQAKVIWETRIDVPGEYEVVAFVHNSSPVIASFLSSETRQSEVKELVYHYTIYSGKEEKTIEIVPKRSSEWVSLGKYYFYEGKASVVLSDKGEPEQFIVADAVKWVKQDP